MRDFTVFYSFLLLSCAALQAGAVDISIIAEKPEPIYSIGEKVRLSVEITDNSGAKVISGTIKFKIQSNSSNLATFNMPFSPENPPMMEIDGVYSGFFLLQAEYLHPGEDKPVTAQYGIGFSPEELLPYYPEAHDFDAFWQKQITEANKLPLDPTFEEMPELSTADYTVYCMSIANINNSRLYGYATIPNAPGTYPVFFEVPGAGLRKPAPEFHPALNHAKVITVVMDVFPFKVPADRKEAEVLLDKHYPNKYYPTYKAEDLQNSFFLRSTIGMLRAVEAIAAHPKMDNKHFVVYGGSQGGAVSTALAALSSHITAAVVHVPSNHAKFYVTKGKHGQNVLLNHALYFTAESFARRIKIPYLASAGMVDTICTPLSISQFFNLIPGPDKKLIYLPHAGHGLNPEYYTISLEFANQHLSE